MLYDLCLENHQYQSQKIKIKKMEKLLKEKKIFHWIQLMSQILIWSVK